MRFRLSAKLLLSTSVLILAMCSHALADCWFDGDITFAKDCDTDFGVNGTVEESGSKLSIENETFDDPNDQTNSFSRIVLKAGDEASGAIDIAVEVVGTTLVDSHNSAAVYLLTKKGNITVDIGADVTLNAQQSGVFAKVDSGTDNPGGMIIVTNAGTITAGTLASGSFVRTAFACAPCRAQATSPIRAPSLLRSVVASGSMPAMPHRTTWDPSATPALSTPGSMQPMSMP